MKKTSMLIAMFAVIAAAPAAKAEGIVDFDGKLKPQSMHDIFSGSHQIVPQEALALVPVPMPVDSDEAPMPMIEPWHIAPQDNCMMVSWVDEDGVLHDCGTQSNTAETCWPVEVTPGVTLPLYLTGNARKALGARPDMARVAAIKTQHFFRLYSTNRPDFVDSFMKMAKDKDVILLYNGDRLLLTKTSSPAGHSQGTSKVLTWGDAVNIVSAGSAVIDAVFTAADNVIPAAVENYYSHQYNDPNQNNNGGSGSTYNNGGNGNGNYDVNKAIKI